MSFLKISSNNPQFSHIMAKNPATIRNSKTPFTRSLRKGKVYGWYDGDQQFNLFFKDADVDNSFGSSEFEYLDKERYGSPMAIIYMITECLRSATSGAEQDVGDFVANSFFVAEIPRSMQPRFNDKTFGGSSVQMIPLRKGSEYCAVKVQAKTVAEALNFSMVLCILCALTLDRERIDLRVDGIAKYLKVLKRSNAPYLMWQLFLVRAISNVETFNKITEHLDLPGVTFQYGNTQIQRFRAVKDALGTSTGSTLVDIGCGEGFHSLRLARDYPEGVVCIEQDEATFNLVSRRVKAKGLEDRVSVVFATCDKESVDSGQGLFDKADVLLVEVLEHIPFKESTALLESVLQTNFNRVVATVPCVDFNAHYGMAPGELRHPDHKWEHSTESNRAMFEEIALRTDTVVKIVQVGDSVNGVTPTLMAVYSKEV